MTKALYRNRKIILIGFLLLCFCSGTGVMADSFSRGSNILVSVATDGNPGNSDSFLGDISSDGRFVTFSSSSSNLVQGMDPPTWLQNIFVRDRIAGTTTLVSTAINGTQANGDSTKPVISSDGRYIAFQSNANNLVLNDTNGRTDIFVYDRNNANITRVSVATDGTEGWGGRNPSISLDGHYIAFESMDDFGEPTGHAGYTYVYIHDINSSTTTRVSVSSSGQAGLGQSLNPSTADKGGIIAFDSSANNLVPNDTNGLADIFVHLKGAKITSRVSIASNGTEGDGESSSPSISDDGRFITFTSKSKNFESGAESKGYGELPDIFVHDREHTTTTRVSKDPNGAPGNYWSHNPSISGDGRYITYDSESTNLVTGLPPESYMKRIFLYEIETESTTLISVAYDGTPADGTTENAVISEDGRYIAFEGRASNLIPGGSSYPKSIYIHDRETSAPTTAPIANFTEDRTIGMVPLTIAYTDTSTEYPTSWLWDFGDQATSTDQNPTHIYTIPGIYTVELEAKNGIGSNRTQKKDHIVALQPRSDMGIRAGTLNLATGMNNTIPIQITNITDAGRISLNVTISPEYARIISIMVNNSVSKGVIIESTINDETGSAMIILIGNTSTFTAGATPLQILEIMVRARAVPGESRIEILDAAWSRPHFAVEFGRIENAILIIHQRADFNGNQRIDIGDVSKVAWMAAGLIEEDFEADFDGENRVGSEDAAKIAYYYVGKISEL
ncbi:PKD domain-containing protein [Methanocalculus taiwanensis]|uniref:PKD domain-containing protein n=1 Tax=Methanocalculus taiwanensis TaxID=106207 RepID=A0ABD4TKX3_9EURY|nr:PKD domain-containing protein [Methanocalculus taiwanensis]MCQ1539096.1 PKD domain-containing protein [Methanocalculus taiwanensis]